MPDDKRGREKQARNAERRQRERSIAEELERGDESEPPIDDDALVDVDADLESVEFPATGATVVAAVGDRTIDTGEERYAVADLVPETAAESFDSPGAVRMRIQRPTVAAAMKRVVEAAESLPNTELVNAQRKAYETTFRELKAIDADDDDEGIRVVADWIVDRIRDDETVPGSRAVRRRAAEFCRENGYEIRNDEWLGI
ncbi:hypothetical protein JCM17823_21030 [Halorubrum gandharaense]